MRRMAKLASEPQFCGPAYTEQFFRCTKVYMTLRIEGLDVGELPPESEPPAPDKKPLMIKHPKATQPQSFRIVS